ncbi:MAG TPA: outer membrane beta-barrel protein [Sandaracinaceae bacterium LLY-WYZ-13_1]|nr:outer membrane beta-barrel protein [Sandaracinaceae bacterium LLY-WYZ-13_1]
MRVLRIVSAVGVGLALAASPAAAQSDDEAAADERTEAGHEPAEADAGEAEVPSGGETAEAEVEPPGGQADAEGGASAHEPAAIGPGGSAGGLAAPTESAAEREAEIPADDETSPADGEAPVSPPPPPPAEDDADDEVTFAPLAYVEAFGAWNFNDPSNGITAYRGFDNRHATFSIANVAFGGRLSFDRVYARVVLQWGLTPSTYYAAEPFGALGGAVGPSLQTLWQVVQEGYFGWNIPLLERGIRLEGGLFLSPVGIEGIAVKDNWNFSRSNLFFGLPFYHTGIRVTVPIDDAWSARVAVYNGWNSVLDNNQEKSVAASVSYADDVLETTLLYFGGVEDDPGVPGRSWRSLFDLTATVHATDWLELQAQVDTGFQPTATDTYVWFTTAAYARVRPVPWLDIALRGDFFWDGAPTGPLGMRQSPIFWPAEWVSSQTLTVALRPVDHLLFMIEYRHDEAASETYFEGAVTTGPDGLGVPNAVRQDTLTLGATAYF